MQLDIQNTGNRPIFDVPLSFSYNQQVYKLSDHMINLPLLIPGVMCAAAAPNLLPAHKAFCRLLVACSFSRSGCTRAHRYKTEISCHVVAEGVADAIARVDREH